MAEEDPVIESPACDTRLKVKEASLVAVEKLLLVGLWITCFLLDLYISCRVLSLLYFLIPLHIIINGFLAKILYNEFGVLIVVLLFLTLQMPLLLLGCGAWHAVRAWHQPDDRLKTQSMLLAKLSLVRVTQHSFEKQSFVGFPAHSLRSCVQPQSLTAPVDDAGLIPGDDAARITSGVQYEAETVRMMKTEFIKGTKKLQMNQGSPLEINVGEPRVYTTPLSCLQELFGPIKKLSYHIVTDSTSTRILHVSCADQLIESMPDQVLSANPLVICNDIHYVLNLCSVAGQEAYSLTKRSLGILTIIRKDLTKLVWFPIWLSSTFKLYFCISSLTKGMDIEAVMPWSIVLGFVTILHAERKLYQTLTDTLILAGYRIFFIVVRVILLCGLGVLHELVIIPISYLTSRAAGLLSFYIYITLWKDSRGMKLFGEAVGKYTFHQAYEPMVQLGESLAYSCWSIYLFFSVYKNVALPFMLITIIGQVIGLVWLRFARARLGQTLRDPSRVFDLIKQIEYIHI